jgi:hypothetical protein
MLSKKLRGPLVDAWTCLPLRYVAYFLFCELECLTKRCICYFDRTERRSIADSTGNLGWRIPGELLPYP